MNFTNDAVYITDLDKCKPNTVFHNNFSKDKWRIIDYETERLSGKMLAASPEAKVPEIYYNLNKKGWHAVFLGIYGPTRRVMSDGIKVRLSYDDSRELITPEVGGLNFPIIDEVFWKYADLEDQDIYFSHPEGGMQRGTYIAYIKIIPLTDKERRKVIENRNDPKTKRLIGMNDGFGIFYKKKPVSEEDIIEDIIPYKDTDFEKLYWCMGTGADVCTYPTKVGEMFGANVEAFPRPGDRNIYESLNILNKKNINPIKTVIKYSKKINLKIYISLRMGAFACNAPWDEIFTGQFYKNNPNWRCMDRNGIEITRMSYAYQGVQDKMIELLMEIASYQPDGISLLFNRGGPFLLYEEPLVKGFIKKTGKDPRLLDEDNIKWLRYRAKFMTNFISDLRKHLDNNIKISAHVLNNKKENLFYGLDLNSWLKKDLVDELVAYPWQIDHKEGKEVDINYYNDLVKGSKCKLYLEVMPRSMKPSQYLEKAINYYENGADGLCFWDTFNRHPKRREWSMIRRLGHKENLNKYVNEENVFYKSVKIKSINKIRVDKYPPVWAF